jgi:hypothetical protein
MIDAGSIRELIETYKKHGWILRRVLLSATAGKALGDRKIELFGDVPVKDCDIDAAWFSRPPKPGGVSWEIRYLGDIPYALLETADEDDPRFESILSVVESHLRESIAAKRTA